MRVTGYAYPWDVIELARELREAGTADAVSALAARATPLRLGELRPAARDALRPRVRSQLQIVYYRLLIVGILPRVTPTRGNRRRT